MLYFVLSLVHRKNNDYLTTKIAQVAACLQVKDNFYLPAPFLKSQFTKKDVLLQAFLLAMKGTGMFNFCVVFLIIVTCF